MMRQLHVSVVLTSTLCLCDCDINRLKAVNPRRSLLCHSLGINWFGIFDMKIYYV